MLAFPGSSLKCNTVVVCLYVVAVVFCWCCPVEVFSGLVVNSGDDLLQLFVGYGSEIGACGYAASEPSDVVLIGFCVALPRRGQRSPVFEREAQRAGIFMFPEPSLGLQP